MLQLLNICCEKFFHISNLVVWALNFKGLSPVFLPAGPCFPVWTRGVFLSTLSGQCRRIYCTCCISVMCLLLPKDTIPISTRHSSHLRDLRPITIQMAIFWTFPRNFLPESTYTKMFEQIWGEALHIACTIVQSRACHGSGMICLSGTVLCFLSLQPWHTVLLGKDFLSQIT